MYCLVLYLAFNNSSMRRHAKEIDNFARLLYTGILHLLKLITNPFEMIVWCARIACFLGLIHRFAFKQGRGVSGTGSVLLHGSKDGERGNTSVTCRISDVCPFCTEYALYSYVCRVVDRVPKLVLW